LVTRGNHNIGAPNGMAPSKKGIKGRPAGSTDSYKRQRRTQKELKDAKKQKERKKSTGLRQTSLAFSFAKVNDDANENLAIPESMDDVQDAADAIMNLGREAAGSEAAGQIDCQSPTEPINDVDEGTQSHSNEVDASLDDDDDIVEMPVVHGEAWFGVIEASFDGDDDEDDTPKAAEMELDNEEEDTDMDADDSTCDSKESTSENSTETAKPTKPTKGVTRSFLDAVMAQLKGEKSPRPVSNSFLWEYARNHGFWLRKECFPFLARKLGLSDDYQSAAYIRDIRLWFPEEEGGLVCTPQCPNCESYLKNLCYPTNHPGRRIFTFDSEYYIMGRQYKCETCIETRKQQKEANVPKEQLIQRTWMAWDASKLQYKQ